jgi:hypothetical protein
MRIDVFAPLLPLLVGALAFTGCRDDVEVRVTTAGLARADVELDVEDLGKPALAALRARAKNGDVDGHALLDEGACAGPCRALQLTLYVHNRGSERAAPPVVRLSSPDGRPARAPIGLRAHEISADRAGRIRFLVSLWPDEKVLDVHLSGSIFIEVNQVEPEQEPEQKQEQEKPEDKPEPEAKPAGDVSPTSAP